MIEQLIILTQIIFIDIILAADNAIIIGLIAANFNPKHRKQIILWGVAHDRDGTVFLNPRSWVDVKIDIHSERLFFEFVDKKTYLNSSTVVDFLKA